MYSPPLELSDDDAALSIKQSADFANCSPSTIRKFIRDGRLEAKKLGRRTIVIRRALKHTLDNLPTIGAVAA